MIRRPPRSTLDRSSAASDVYKRQHPINSLQQVVGVEELLGAQEAVRAIYVDPLVKELSLIHISEPTRPY